MCLIHKMIMIILFCKWRQAITHVSFSSSFLEDKEASDHVTNYARQVIQMGLMLMNLNDTEREGDGARSVLNWKILLLYFRSRKRGQKYAFEAMRFLSNVKALYSAKMAHRAIHGRFVNQLGGDGRNVANDLK